MFVPGCVRPTEEKPHTVGVGRFHLRSSAGARPSGETSRSRGYSRTISLSSRRLLHREAHDVSPWRTDVRDVTYELVFSTVNSWRSRNRRTSARPPTEKRPGGPPRAGA